jgi:excisionase family DNA binding protein
MNTTDINIGMAGFRGSVPIVEIASGDPKPEPKIEPKFYTMQEVCTLLAVSESTIRRLEAAGEMPKRIKHKFGRNIRFSKRQIDLHIEGLEA